MSIYLYVYIYKIYLYECKITVVFLYCICSRVSLVERKDQNHVSSALFSGESLAVSHSYGHKEQVWLSNIKSKLHTKRKKKKRNFTFPSLFSTTNGGENHDILV